MGSIGSGFRSTANVTSVGRTGLSGGPGFAHASNSAYPTASFAAGQRIGNTPSGTVRNVSPLPTVNNAWTDPTNPRVTGSSNLRPGNHLYPGAYGYAPGNPANGHSQHGTDGSRGHRRYYYNNFPYPVYFPAFYGGYGSGGYAGNGNLGYYGGTADYAGLTADNSVADLGAPDFSTTPNAYYSYAQPSPQAPPSADQPAPTQPLPDAPAVGPQNPTGADKSTGASSGPDSLVEAVQGELSRRGYFEGKPDAIYSPATKEAIRRFQTDQKLPATGRINEATLHALKLD